MALTKTNFEAYLKPGCMSEVEQDSDIEFVLEQKTKNQNLIQHKPLIGFSLIPGRIEERKLRCERRSRNCLNSKQNLTTKESVCKKTKYRKLVQKVCKNGLCCPIYQRVYYVQGTKADEQHCRVFLHHQNKQSCSAVH